MNTNTFIVANAASGKSVAKYAEVFGKDYHQQLKMSSQELMKEYRKTKWEYDKTKKSENIAEPKKTYQLIFFVPRDTLEASLVVYLLSYWDFLLVLAYLVIFNCYEKTILIIVILFLLYLWA